MWSEEEIEDFFENYADDPKYEGIDFFINEYGSWGAHFHMFHHLSVLADSPEKAMEQLKKVWNLMKESIKI